MKSAAYLAIFYFVFLWREQEVNLKEFSLADDVFESGKDLMSLPFGLHELEKAGSLQETLIIAVHGSNSRGYEWIYPLISLNDSDNLMAFFRWDDGSCPDLVLGLYTKK